MMRRRAMTSLLLAATCVACGTHGGEVIVDDNPSDARPDLAGDSFGLPTVTIRTPEDSACVGEDGTRPADLEISVTSWTLAPLGGCGGAAACGPAYVSIDGHDCDAAGLPYHLALTSGSEATMYLVRCKSGPEGLKRLRVELHDDDGTLHSPVVADERAVTFEVCH